MSKYKCEYCEKEFDTNQHLKNHLNKKYKCSEKTDYKCDQCNKYFKNKNYLRKHSLKCYNITKNDEFIDEYKDGLNTDDKIKNTISLIVNSEESIDNKIKFLSIYKFNMIEENLRLLLGSTMSNENKVYIIYSAINNNSNNTNTNSYISNNTQSNSHNNTNSNNTINNIQINQYGKENIDYLDDKYFEKILKKKTNFETSLIDLTKDIHLRLDHPENRNIKVTNLNNKYATIYDNGKWRGITKDSLKESLYKKNIKLIKIHFDRLKDVLDDKHKNNVKIFLGRDFDDDPVLKEINDKVILLFYSKEE